MFCSKHSSFAADNHDHQSCIISALTVAEELCRLRGERFTPLRRRVLELVWQQHKPIGAYEILEQLQEQGKAAPPTVYRALNFLLRLGLVHRLMSLNAYVGCVRPGDCHDGQFFICQSCKALAEVEIPAVVEAIATSSRSLQFEVRTSTVEILGLCPHCAKGGAGD
jgi:Fur family transcriptional regulator, zinc uptake regulator